MTADKRQLQQITRAGYIPRSAEILDAATNNPFQLQRFDLTLTAAKSEQDPFIISFPFKGILLKSGTDNLTNVDVKFNRNDQGISKVNMVTNDAISSEHMFSSAYISWSAQSGKTITVYVFVDSSFNSGSLINSGTVTTSVNSTGTITNPALTAATATSVLAQNLARREANIQNKDTASVFIGYTSSVAASGANAGIELKPGTSMKIQNTAQIYAISTAGLVAGLLTISEET